MYLHVLSILRRNIFRCFQEVLATLVVDRYSVTRSLANYCRLLNFYILTFAAQCCSKRGACFFSLTPRRVLHRLHSPLIDRFRVCTLVVSVHASRVPADNSRDTLHKSHYPPLDRSARRAFATRANLCRLPPSRSAIRESKPDELLLPTRKGSYSLDNFPLAGHAAVSLDEVLLTPENGQAHEELTQCRR